MRPRWPGCCRVVRNDGGYLDGTALHYFQLAFHRYAHVTSSRATGHGKAAPAETAPNAGAFDADVVLATVAALASFRDFSAVEDDGALLFHFFLKKGIDYVKRLSYS